MDLSYNVFAYILWHVDSFHVCRVKTLYNYDFLISKPYCMSLSTIPTDVGINPLKCPFYIIDHSVNFKGCSKLCLSKDVPIVHQVSKTKGFTYSYKTYKSFIKTISFASSIFLHFNVLISFQKFSNIN